MAGAEFDEARAWGREFFADSDSEAEFEGFDLQNESVEDLSLRSGIFTVPDLDNDKDFDTDTAMNWSRSNDDPERVPFTGRPGVNIHASGSSPLDFLNLFIPDNQFETFCIETNRYAQQQRAQRGVLSQHDRMNLWQPTTNAEMKAWFGLLVLSGLIEKPHLEKYWSIDSVISTPIFGNTMSRDRFLSILQFFHVNNNENFVPRGNTDHDPLFKVRPLYDEANHNFRRVYTPQKQISVDEGMVPWKGRLIFKQYLPNKPDKFGMKMYSICDSTNGYILTADVYTGKDYDPNPDADANLGHTYDVVMGLLSRCDLLNKGYEIYVDNFYTSPKLFDDLYAKQTLAVGTVRLNRKEMPVALKSTKLKKGEMIYRQRGNLTALKWKDKREVSMLSTIHKGTMTVTNKVEHVSGEPIVKPTAILDYNLYMGGVDRNDQLNKYNTFIRKTQKWWKKLAFAILNMAITNAFIMYKQCSSASGAKLLSQYDFCRELGRQLVSYAPQYCAKGQRHTGTPERRLIDRHFPQAIPPAPGAKNPRPCRVCVVCSPAAGTRHTKGESRKRTETRCWCPECEKPLCVDPCFRLYHTLQNYRASQAQGRDVED